MRNALRSIAFGMAMLVVVVGCRTDFTAETNATESLLGVLTRVENSSASIDARLIKQYRKDVSEKCAKIQQELSDTLALEQAQILVNFCALDEHLQSCLKRKELIDTEVTRTRNQLFNLKTDLLERRADKDSANLHIEQEFLFVESLNEGVDQVVAELNGCFETYAELKDEIDRLLIALPKKEVD
jgi:chromosome segregation ATPase